MTTVYVGNDHDEAPWRSIVYVEATFGNGETYTGSGVVVGRNDVLTAAHVVYDASAGGAAESVVVYPGFDNRDEPFGSFTATTNDHFEVDDDGDGLIEYSEIDEDIAVLGFSDPIGDVVGWFGIDPNATDGNYNLTGYPGVYETNGNPRMTNDFGFAYSIPEDGIWESTDIEANEGNSGGPLWYESDGTPYVVGVLSSGVDAFDNAMADVVAHYETLIGWLDGNDSLLSGDVNQVSGSANSETLEGTNGVDSLSGGGGGDVLVGGPSGDTLDGGSGVDWVFFTTSLVGVIVRLWDDQTESGGDAAGDRLVSIENVRGSVLPDLLSGSEDANVLEGLEGDDSIHGRGSDDILRGSYGDDTLDAGDGADAAVGGPGNDTVLGGSGDDALRGNSQNDLVRGQGGNDRAYGNIGGDRVYGDTGLDTLWGLSGNDRLYGGAGNDTLFGGWGGDILQGGDGSDTLRGDGGRDIFQFTEDDIGQDVIEDFELGGSESDLIDLHRWFDQIGYTGTTPVTDGIVLVSASGPDAEIQVQDGTGFTSVAVVLDTSATSLANDGVFVTDDTYWFGV